MPEFKRVVVIKSAKPCPPPAPPPQKLTQAWRVPPGCHCAIPLLPAGSKIFKVLGQEGSQEVAHDQDSKLLHRFTVGIQWRPEEFVHAALQAGHPSNFEQELPPAPKTAVCTGARMSQAELVAMREAWLSKWEKRKLELCEEEKQFKATLHSDVACWPHGPHKVEENRHGRSLHCSANAS